MSESSVPSTTSTGIPKDFGEDILAKSSVDFFIESLKSKCYKFGTINILKCP